MDVSALVDDGLEVTVVGSFTNIGYGIRRGLYRWAAPEAGALQGRTVLITGPTSGLGRTATGTLAQLGARVILVGRSHDRLAAVRDELVAVHGVDRFPIVVADMGSLGSVRDAVAQVLETETRLDVLIDNAGAIYPGRLVGPDGIEATLATLVIGPFVLESGLLPLLQRTTGSRVIAVTSGGMYTQRLHLDDMEWAAERFSGPRAYARAKRAQVVLVREWARRLRGSGPAVNAMHPGWADTPGLAEALPGFHSLMQPLLRSPAEGIDTLVWLASDPGAGAAGGSVFLDRRPRPFDRVPATRVTAADRRRLWEIVVGLSGSPDPLPTE